MTTGDTVASEDGIFSPELLARCISCGFCLPSCPTYKLTGQEASSPRGRITLMRALETGRLPEDDPTLAEESSFCLGCRACEPVCPAGVQYGALLEEWRSHQWRRPPLRLRLLLFAVRRRWRVRLMGLVRRHARTRASGAPSLMLGCFERVMYPEVSRSARRVAPELTAPARQSCCGALHAHNGQLEVGREMARALGAELPGTIVTTSGGCAAHLASVLGQERVRELSDWLVERVDLGSVPPLMVDGRPARIALQDSCHLRNGLGGTGPPRELLRRLGEYVELPSAGACCGAAGTYSLLRRDDSRRVFAPKLREIDAAGVDYVVAVNPGCLRQLRTELHRAGSKTRAVHIATLLASAAASPSLRMKGTLNQ